MTPRDMQTNCAKNGTAPRSSKPRSFRKKSDFQQWRGMQADEYAKWYCADTFLRECLRSLQVIDLKGKNELRNCALLQIRKVVQFDTATFLLVVRSGAFPLVQTDEERPMSKPEKTTRAPERIGTRAHLNRDGHPAPLAVWRCYCRACGAPFEVLTPAQRAEGAARPARVHCDRHKLPRGWGKNARPKMPAAPSTK